MSAADVVAVRVSPAERTEDWATWAQHGQLLAHGLSCSGEIGVLGRQFTVPGDVPVGRVVAAITRLIDLHQGLRTVISTPTLLPSRQHVLDTAAPIVVHDSASREDATTALAGRFAPSTLLECLTRSSAQFQVYAVRGRVVAIRVAVPHVFCDRHALRLLRRQLFDEIGAPGATQPGYQPLERTRMESAARYTAISQAAIARWRHVLTETVPQPAPVPDDPACVEQSLVAPALESRLEQLSAATGLASSTILAAAAADAAARGLGLRTVHLKVEFANRFTRADRTHFGCLLQPGLLRFATQPDCDVAQAAARIARDLVVAQRHAVYDPLEMGRMITELPTPARLAVFYNDKRSVAATRPAPPAERDEPWLDVRHDVGRLRDVYSDIYLTASTDPAGVRLTVRSVDAVVRPAVARSMLVHIALALGAGDHLIGGDRRLEWIWDRATAIVSGPDGPWTPGSTTGDAGPGT